MTTVENRWTVGNIAKRLQGSPLAFSSTSAGLCGGGLRSTATVATLSSRIEAQASDTEKRLNMQANDNRRQLDLQSAMLGNYDVRLRDVERGYARLDEKVSTILDTVRGCATL